MNISIRQVVCVMTMLFTLATASGATDLSATRDTVQSEASASFQMAQTETDVSRKIFHGMGVITATKPVGSLTINHQAIEGLMPAMEMMFPVTPPALTKGIRPGDTVEFSVDGKTYTIVAIKPRGHGN